MLIDGFKVFALFKVLVPLNVVPAIQNLPISVVHHSKRHFETDIFEQDLVVSVKGVVHNFDDDRGIQVQNQHLGSLEGEDA